MPAITPKQGLTTSSERQHQSLMICTHVAVDRSIAPCKGYRPECALNDLNGCSVQRIHSGRSGQRRFKMRSGGDVARVVGFDSGRCKAVFADCTVIVLEPSGGAFTLLLRGDATLIRRARASHCESSTTSYLSRVLAIRDRMIAASEGKPSPRRSCDESIELRDRKISTCTWPNANEYHGGDDDNGVIHSVDVRACVASQFGCITCCQLSM